MPLQEGPNVVKSRFESKFDIEAVSLCGGGRHVSVLPASVLCSAEEHHAPRASSRVRACAVGGQHRRQCAGHLCLLHSQTSAVRSRACPRLFHSQMSSRFSSSSLCLYLPPSSSRFLPFPSPSLSVPFSMSPLFLPLPSICFPLSAVRLACVRGPSPVSVVLLILVTGGRRGRGPACEARSSSHPAALQVGRPCGRATGEKMARAELSSGGSRVRAVRLPALT